MKPLLGLVNAMVYGIGVATLCYAFQWRHLKSAMIAMVAVRAVCGTDAPRSVQSSVP